ncbi:hypothetical protein Q9Q95_15440 [Sphingomonas sp. DG1-23]|uniref:hypothetical protein n=1 Tax=Sphingomonas sp. DG1-23 TaxID=3068316 RepID=UPI00273ECCF4|nr:hypothetical protein [Sphingomonas sp. DG1-23]MDP5280322.1 hypothetical protein [Sphingomonas sp. DG1-23]
MMIQHALLSLMIGATPAAAQVTLSPADQAAAFKAAGFEKHGAAWHGCGDPGTASYTPGAIETVRDLDGDGRPEAVITEGSTACFGGDEMGYTLVSKQADRSWKSIASGTGILAILATKGVAGWPDLEIGGQGFCFPVQRWNGKAYVLHRHQYEGKPCRPAR